MTQTAHVVDEYNIRRAQVILHDTEMPNFEGRLAINLVERWGMVAGATDEEDSQGRAKITLQPPEKVVERACATAQLLLAELRTRGWMTNVPGYDEMKGIIIKMRAEEAARDEQAALDAPTRRR